MAPSRRYCCTLLWLWAEGLRFFRLPRARAARANFGHRHRSQGFVLLSYTTASFFIDLHGSSSYTLLLVSFIDEEVEKTHFGREEAYNCPLAIRPLINQLRNSKF